jgi:sporulation protein YlmC with PRC-barrel domain
MQRIRLLEILGRRVIDSNGETIGHLEEIEAEQGSESCLVQAYLVEHRKLLDRLSTWALTSSMQEALSRRSTSKPFRVPWHQMDLSEPRRPKTRVPKSELRQTVD